MFPSFDKLPFPCLTALMLSACATSQPPPSTPAPAPVPTPIVASPAHADSDTMVTAPPDEADYAHGSGLFAPSPLTALADELVALNDAALQGRRLPPHRIDIEPMKDDIPVVHYRDDSDGTPQNLQYLVFGVEMDIVFDKPFPSDPDDPEERGALRVVVLLSRIGWKVVNVSPRPSPSTPSIPQWLSGVEDIGRAVFQAARERRLDALMVGEPERNIIAHEAFFRAIQKEVPDRQRLLDVGKLVSERSPTGYRVDSLILIARDDQNEIWGFEYDMDRKDGAIVLDARPFVRVSRFKTR
jgi:hypothetical protein